MASLIVNFVKTSDSDCGEVHPGVISYDEKTRKKGNSNKVNPHWKIL